MIKGGMSVRILSSVLCLLAVLFSPTGVFSPCGASLSVGTAAGSDAVPSVSAAPVHRVEAAEGMVALTFDDGPHPRYTDAILSILSEYQAHATFFVIGVNLIHYPDPALRARSEGHELGNHTYSHPHLTGKSAAELKRQLNLCERVFRETTGTVPHLFRPPEGVERTDCAALLSSLGYRQILWSIDTRDWEGASAQVIAKRVLSQVQSGDIILMHDYVSHPCVLPDALRIILPALTERGLRVVTVSELLAAMP